MLLFMASVVDAKSVVKYSGIDSLAFRTHFYMDVYDDTNQERLTKGKAGWSSFDVEVIGGDFSKGVVRFSRNLVYQNKDMVVVKLKHHYGKLISTDSIEVPSLRSIRLNYKVAPGNAGEYLPLEIKGITQEGTLQTTEKPGELSWDDFLLTCRGDTVNPRYFFIPFHTDLPRQLAVKATFLHDTSINHTLQIPVTYSDSLYFDFNGAKGRRGANGKPGDPNSLYNRDGGRGENGGEGHDPIGLNVVIIPLESENGDLLKVLMISDSFQHFFFLHPDSGRVFIELNGGMGGRGGNGGNGATGLETARQVKLHKGGDGGNGGHGGNGGNGGKMYLITNKQGQAYAQNFYVSNDGGKGGLGGFGGQGGKSYLRENMGFFERIFFSKKGEDGEIGSRGYNGYASENPILWLIDDEELLDLLLDSETW